MLVEGLSGGSLFIFISVHFNWWVSKDFLYLKDLSQLSHLSGPFEMVALLYSDCIEATDAMDIASSAVLGLKQQAGFSFHIDDVKV